jgi:hypothetical protein
MHNLNRPCHEQEKEMRKGKRYQAVDVSPLPLNVLSIVEINVAVDSSFMAPNPSSTEDDVGDKIEIDEICGPLPTSTVSAYEQK